MHAQSMKVKIIIGSIILVLVLFGVDRYLSRGSRPSIPGLNNIEDIKRQGGTVEIDNSGGIVRPDLDKKVVVKSSVSEEAKAIILGNIQKLQDTLKKDPKDFNAWNTLGVYYKAVEDFPAAIEVWNYVGRAFPNNHVSFSNLAFLYGYYLKEPIKAEQNYLQAIKNAPLREDVYIQAVEYHRDVVKDSAKALKIAEEGYKKLPSSTNLKTIITALKK